MRFYGALAQVVCPGGAIRARATGPLGTGTRLSPHVELEEEATNRELSLSLEAVTWANVPWSLFTEQTHLISPFPSASTEI